MELPLRDKPFRGLRPKEGETRRNRGSSCGHSLGKRILLAEDNIVNQKARA